MGTSGLCPTLVVKTIRCRDATCAFASGNGDDCHLRVRDCWQRPASETIPHIDSNEMLAQVQYAAYPTNRGSVMVRNAQGTVEFDASEQAVVDAFAGSTESTVRKVVAEAGKQTAQADVRKAYWELVSEGVIVLTGSGRVRLSQHAG